MAFDFDFTVRGDVVHTLIELVIGQHQNEAGHLLGIIEQAVEQKVLDGSDFETALQEVLDDFINGRGEFKAWGNRQNKLIAEMNKRLIAQPVQWYADENPNTKFAWVLGSVKTSHCPDCIKLSNMPARTIKEWKALGYGLPRWGETKCNVGCQCMLKPVR